MAERKSATVHYRKLADPTKSFGQLTLEQAVRQAMSHEAGDKKLSANWKHRAFSPGVDGSSTLLVNIYHDSGDSYFGDLTLFTKGFMQSLLKQEDDKPMLAVEQSPPPNGREYIHSMMYWMVIGDHLLAIQSQSLNSRQLEVYLTWLLNEETSVIGSDGHVILDAKFDADEIGGELDDISEIIVGGTGAVAAAPIVLTDEAEMVSEVESISDVAKKRPWGQRAIDVLRAVMSSEADVMALLNNLPDGADLDVSVKIGYKTKKRKLSREPMQRALRNLPEGDIVAKARGGNQKGQDIRLSHPVRILRNGSLYDPDDVRTKLRSTYDYFVENGKITP